MKVSRYTSVVNYYIVITVFCFLSLFLGIIEEPKVIILAHLFILIFSIIYGSSPLK